MEKQKSSKRKYRNYDASFKLDAVNQLKNGRSPKELSELLGVSESLLYKWKRQELGKGRNGEQSEEIKQLKRQLKQAEEEYAILKKALSIFSRSD